MSGRDVLEARGGSLVPAIEARGYRVEYRGDGHDHCPGCSRSNWHVGRVSVECAFCGTTLPLPAAPKAGGGGSWRPGASASGPIEPAAAEQPGCTALLGGTAIALAAIWILIPGAAWLAIGAP